ncbi:MAG: hypothetical protein HQL24_00275 [Candidatus Omnitrophica bacterium]|nr:hypothetical protein [Candidatus Omnitrophota bacterium]
MDGQKKMFIVFGIVILIFVGIILINQNIEKELNQSSEKKSGPAQNVLSEKVIVPNSAQSQKSRLDQDSTAPSSENAISGSSEENRPNQDNKKISYGMPLPGMVLFCYNKY